MSGGRTSTGRRLAKLILRSRPVVTLQDRSLNRRWRGDRPGILLLRHPSKGPWFYWQFLDWLRMNFPEVRTRFELALLPGEDVDPTHFRLLVPWLQDPIQQWSADAHAQACRLAERFTAQGIPVVNAPEALDNTTKSAAAATARDLGIRAPRMMALEATEGLRTAVTALGFPIIVRPDWGHRHTGLRIDRPGDLHCVTGHALSAMDRPLAIEFIDTGSPDGLFRKYRYLAAGSQGVSVHLIASAHWEVRGENKVSNPALTAEELAFITAPNPHAATFERLRHALGLDLVAFDYGYDRSGTLVVWEANAYPSISFGPETQALRYRSTPVHRCFAAMAALYLSRASIAVPAELIDIAEDAAGAVARCATLRRRAFGPRRIASAILKR